MFFDLYRFRLKILLKDKMLFFWTLIFPVMLGTFFWMAFSDITKQTEQTGKISVALVKDGEYENGEQFDAFLEQVSGKNGKLKLYRVSADDAYEMLEADDVCGIINFSENISVEFKENGIEQTILKTMIDYYIQNEQIVMDVMKTSPQKLENIVEKISEDTTYNREKKIVTGSMDVYVQYYFALIAMTCLFGSSYGMKNARDIEISQSDVAKRRKMAPVGKSLNIITDFLSAITVQIIIFVLLFIYLAVFLGISFGDRYVYILIAGVVAGAVGVSYGYMLGIILKCNENLKDSLMRATTLFMCFLSGLMIGNMKHVIESNAPIINKLNPAAVISDSFYSLCIFDDMDMYVRCVITMVLMSVLFLGVSAFKMRHDYS